MSLWGRIKESRKQSYNISHLVNDRVMNEAIFSECQTQIICDIDKTYLETEFESVVKMARIAFESAQDKVTVEGAADLLYSLRWARANVAFEKTKEILGPNAGLHFVSSSPPQLRPVLEEKLRMDGLDWDSDTFKNQMYNIRKARLDLLKQHVGYKTLAILKMISHLKPESSIYLIGDNAESDPVIYFGIKAFLEGFFTRQDFAAYLHECGVEASVVKEMAPLMKSNGQRVKGVFIRRLSSKPLIEWQPFSDVISHFRNYFELVLFFYWLDLIPFEALEKLVRRFKNRFGLTDRRLKNYLEIFLNGIDTKSAKYEQLRLLAKKFELELSLNVVSFRSDTEFGFSKLEACRDARNIWSHHEGKSGGLLAAAMQGLNQMRHAFERQDR